MSILDDIVAYKKEEIKQDKKQYPLQFFMDLVSGEIPPTRDFFARLADSAYLALITELKFASPSRGVINQRENLGKIIKSYNQSGAAAISVLTDDHFFQGELDDIQKVKKISKLPILRKDFIIDEYQIYQSRCLGADAILLIASLLDISQLAYFQEIANSLTMDCLIEVHNKKELEQALAIEVKMIGINNRNLDDFSVDLSNTIKLSQFIPQDCLLVSESGIRSRQDIEKLNKYEIDAVLIGEALMTDSDPRDILKDLTNILKRKKKRRKPINAG